MDIAPHFYAKDRAAWRTWLREHHDKERAVWLVYDKGVHRTLTWTDIVQEALCFGWIDSRPGKVSDTQSKLYISQRKPKSVWSKINKAHVEYLKREGLMMRAGLEAIEIAQKNGSWNTLNKSDNLEQPDELKTAFVHHPSARHFFDTLSNSNKRNTLQWLYDAKTNTTLEKRISQVVERCSEGLNPR